VIEEVSIDEIERRITQYEARYPEFPAVYSKPTCCPGCLVDYIDWDIEQCDAWSTYYSLRWLRGDEVTHE
jgi:hypothetical protein